MVPLYPKTRLQATKQPWKSRNPGLLSHHIRAVFSIQINFYEIKQPNFFKGLSSMGFLWYNLTDNSIRGVVRPVFEVA